MLEQADMSEVLAKLLHFELLKLIDILANFYIVWVEDSSVEQ